MMLTDTKAIVLARGLGTRMQVSDTEAEVSIAQARAADVGHKAMMPLAFGRPFLDWVLSALADAGVRDICLVIAPDHVAIRHYYSALTLTRIRISFALQPEARGTADAVLAAEAFVRDERFMVLNGDNYYPADAYRALISLGGSGLAAFERESLLAHGNIGPDRIARYALADVDEDGLLRRIVEKPDAAAMAAWSGPQFVSMNLWMLPREIFVACRAIRPSLRDEQELPVAVQYAIDELGVELRAVPMRGPGAGVLDLTSRADIQTVTARLSGRRPVL
ncbi:MAG: nucleotidyltransferase family protein [Gemmatimonadaceae bacterium]